MTAFVPKGEDASEEVTPAMIEAGLQVVDWWNSEAFGAWYDEATTTLPPHHVLVREVWIAMHAARKG